MFKVLQVFDMRDKTKLFFKNQTKIFVFLLYSCTTGIGDPYNVRTRSSCCSPNCVMGTTPMLHLKMKEEFALRSIKQIQSILDLDFCLKFNIFIIFLKFKGICY